MDSVTTPPIIELRKTAAERGASPFGRENGQFRRLGYARRVPCHRRPGRGTQSGALERGRFRCQPHGRHPDSHRAHTRRRASRRAASQHERRFQAGHRAGALFGDALSRGHVRRRRNRPSSRRRRLLVGDQRRHARERHQLGSREYQGLRLRGRGPQRRLHAARDPGPSRTRSCCKN